MDATDSPEQRAIDKSRQTDPDLGRVSRVRAGEYSCLGNSGWWTVRVGPGGYTCDCPGGTHGRKCWHMGSVFRMRLAARALCQKPAPAPTPAPAPKSAREELWDYPQGMEPRRHETRKEGWL